MAIERVFSGVQPTGNLHLGNYLGAIVNFVKLQDTHSCIYCVVDMHAITVWQDPKELTRTIREVTAAFIAAGIDPRTRRGDEPLPADYSSLAYRIRRLPGARALR